MSKNKVIFYVILGGLIIWAFAALLIMIGLHCEYKMDYSWKLFSISVLIYLCINGIIGIMAFFGFYLPRFGPPQNSNNTLEKKN
jgi:hypothetical protein